MITINADNRVLLEGSKYSYLSNNYSAGVTSLVVDNVSVFKINDYVLLGAFGSQNAEIVKISNITSATKTLTVSTTSFPHSESTRVSVVPYNQVKFYWTATATFATTTPLNGGVAMDVQANSVYTMLIDGSNDSGYGWFVFYKSLSIGSSTSQFDITNPSGTTFRYTFDGTGTDPDIINRVFVGSEVVIAGQNFNAGNNGTFVVTAVGINYFEVTNATGVVESNKTLGTGSLTVNIVSGESNAIPYGGFEENSVNNILRDFRSILNQKENNLISDDDALSWLNEAYSLVINELNMVNSEYMAEELYTINVVAGTKEYALPERFSNLISLTTGTDNTRIDSVHISAVDENDGYSGGDVRYYIRGGYIGFSPTPTENTTYKLRYNTTAPKVSSVDDSLVIPDNIFYCLKDYMMFRAAPKLSRVDGNIFYQNFVLAVNRLKMNSHKRDNNPDSWDLSVQAWV